jgi:APA family basic amino acid/polyamine antiporter
VFWVSNVLACGAVSSALGDAVAAVLPPSMKVAVHGVVAAGAVIVISAINIGGIERGIRLVSFSTLVKLVPLAIFVGVGLFAIHGENFVRPATIGASDVGHTLLLTLFAFQGFETSLSVGGEIRDPVRTIPLAILMALSGVTVLYIAVQVIAQGILGPALANSAVPLADAMGRVSPALRVMMLVGTAVSMFGWLTSDLLGSPRILFAFARDDLLPRVLGRLSERGRAPYVAIICYSAIAIALALSGSFADLAALAALSLAVLYIAACLASWQLARRGVAQAGTPLGFRWMGVATAIGVGSMLAVMALASRTEIVGLLVLTGLSLLGYLVQTRVLHPRSTGQPAV